MTTTNVKSADLVSELDALAKSAVSAEGLMKSIVALLHEKLTKYNWVGFYMLEKEGGDVLVLGPFKGTMTPHTRIPLNQGICGAAAFGDEDRKLCEHAAAVLGRFLETRAR